MIVCMYRASKLQFADWTVRSWGILKRQNAACMIKRNGLGLIFAESLKKERMKERKRNVAYTLTFIHSNLFQTGFQWVTA